MTRVGDYDETQKKEGTEERKRLNMRRGTDWIGFTGCTVDRGSFVRYKLLTRLV